jgi:hypothetical protein
VTLAEPATLVTDYLLGGLSEFLAVLLVRRNQALRQTSITLWAAALMAAAMASFAGGTYHGFHHLLAPPVPATLWKVTTISMGIASFLLLSAAVFSTFSGVMRRRLVAAAAVKLVIYIGWMVVHDAFVFVILDYGFTLIVILFLVTTGWTNGVPGHRAYISAGILTSIAAAMVQQSGFRLHEHFNHNDLMHVIQMGGVWLLFMGGARLLDRGGVNAAQP